MLRLTGEIDINLRLDYVRTAQNMFYAIVAEISAIVSLQIKVIQIIGT